MLVYKTIVFERSDMPFVEKQGALKASEMAKEYTDTHPTPFIYDTVQLAGVLHMDCKDMFDVIHKKESHYKTIKYRKKNGGTRTITAPDRTLVMIQRRILHFILDKMNPSSYATAYHSGSTLYDNAKPHVGKKYILKLDITDFFGSITFRQVLSSAFNSKVYNKQIGYLLTEFCTLNDALPQGAPTSPAISNLVMKQFDENIGSWCKAHKVSYTRYCDDMTFSADEPLFNVYIKVRKMLREMGFSLNEEKTRFVSSGRRQTVTGLTVNEKVSVPREYKREIRQIMHYVEKYGFDEKVCSSMGCKSFYESASTLTGRIQYVLQIEPENKFFREARKTLSWMFANAYNSDPYDTYLAGGYVW